MAVKEDEFDTEDSWPQSGWLSIILNDGEYVKIGKVLVQLGRTWHGKSKLIINAPQETKITKV